MAPAKPKKGTLIEQAILDLRDGKPVTVKSGGQAIVIAAAEHGDRAQVERLKKTLRSEPLLVLTPERAAALGVATKKPAPVAIALSDKKILAHLAGIVDPTRARRPIPSLAAHFAAKPLLLAAPALALIRLASLLPAAVIYPVKPGAKKVPSVAVNAADIAHYAKTQSTALERISEARIPLESLNGKDALLIAFRPKAGFHEHLALVIGEPHQQKSPLVRIHSSCLTGDLLGSLRCDCGGQLQLALKNIADAGHGVLVYLAQEGRGIGIAGKLKAYALQDKGMHTWEANEALGFAADERDFRPAAAILKSLGIKTIRLLTNNPEKIRQLKAAGITVSERLALKVAPHEHNEPYLTAKATLGGHWL